MKIASKLMLSVLAVSIIVTCAGGFLLFKSQNEALEQNLGSQTEAVGKLYFSIRHVMAVNQDKISYDS